ncbi:MAG: hypothetical protein AB1489_21805 [Acidobacteriota bacterium]
MNYQKEYLRPVRILTIGISFALIISLFQTNREKTRADNQDNKTQNIRYLLIFKGTLPGYRGERNFYEFAHSVDEVYGRSFPPESIATSGTARYGVFAAMKAKVLKTSNSKDSPKATNKSVYILVYDPIYTVCAKSYTITTNESGNKKISYTDYQSGKSYEFPITKKRPFDIYEVEIITGDILQQIWEEKRRK